MNNNAAKKKQVVIFGGWGFIGMNLVQAMLKYTNHDIVVIDKFATPTEYNVEIFDPDSEYGPRLKVVRADIGSPDQYIGYICNADLVYNFAAESHVDESFKYFGEFMMTNVVGATALCETIAEANPTATMIHMSTDEVYGNNDHINSEESYSPRNPYAVSKLAADYMLTNLAMQHNMKLAIIKATNFFGPWQHSSKFLPKVILSAIAGDPVTVYGIGSERRAWVYVEEFARRLAICSQEHDPVGCCSFNGLRFECFYGSCCSVKNLDMVLRINKLIGREQSLVAFSKQRIVHDGVYALERDSATVVNEPADSELLATINWYKANRRVFGV